MLIDLETDFAGVVADTRTRAWAACAALELRWEGGTHVGSADLDALLVPGDGVEIRRDGSVSNAFADGITVDAEYATPLAAHAHLEPLAALARVTPGGAIEAWVPTQAPDTVTGDLRTQFGEDREVIIHVTQLGGSFGRKAGQHLAVEATRLAEAVGAPVHLGFTREQDLRHGFYRPPPGPGCGVLSTRRTGSAACSRPPPAATSSGRWPGCPKRSVTCSVSTRAG